MVNQPVAVNSVDEVGPSYGTFSQRVCVISVLIFMACFGPHTFVVE